MRKAAQASLASSSSFLAMSRSALVAMSLRENSVALASAEDLYDILGIDESATEREIKNACVISN